jgi:hypothetical protein
MATRKNTPKEEVSEILEVTQGSFECCLLGTSPMILNRMSEKAKHELLLPKGRKTAAEKATTLKHNPVDEYRASVYRITDPNAQTYLAHLSTAFKGALRTAALDMPGAKKSQIGRLTYVNGDYVGIFGIPKLFMSVTRSADINKTPDIRTRAIVPNWACRLKVTYVQPLIKAQAVANLLAAAGLTIGVGDWRPEKGAGSYGQFRLVAQDDPDFLSVIESGGRAAQIAALETPECYDDESAEMLSWFDEEVARRQLRGVA